MIACADVRMELDTDAMNAASLRIPMPPVLEPSYGAYVRVPRAPGDPKKIGAAWASRVCEEPIRSMLTKLIESELVSVQALPKNDEPRPPIGLLRAARMGAEEERRFEEATHFVLVHALFPLWQPPLNVFAALAVANGLAASFDGVVIDLQVPRLLPVRSLEEAFPSDGGIVIANHVVCPMSTSDGGALWMTTSGMRRFGLPNFEMRHIPPNLQETVVLMNAVAHRVLHEALAQVSRAGNETIAEIALPDELTITQEDMVAALGKGDASAGKTTVRLSFDGKGRGTMEPFITVGPPASYAGELGDWYYDAMRELTGKSAERVPIERPKGDEALERSRIRAVREWPALASSSSRAANFRSSTGPCPPSRCSESRQSARSPARRALAVEEAPRTSQDRRGPVLATERRAQGRETAATRTWHVARKSGASRALDRSRNPSRHAARAAAARRGFPARPRRSLGRGRPQQGARRNLLDTGDRAQAGSRPRFR
jgi:hypothetical protein